MSGTGLRWEEHGATCYGTAGRHTVAMILPSGTPDTPTRLLWGCLGRSDIAHDLPAAQAACQAAWAAFVADAGLVSAGEADGWRSIETAPTDETRILLYARGGTIAVGHCYRGPEGFAAARYILDGATLPHPGITHWRPLPKPPGDAP